MVFGRYATDIWQVGIVNAPLSACMDAKTFASAPVTWLPERKPFTYIADPFGLWRTDILYLFVEAFDYRDKKGRIECHIFDKQLIYQHHETVLEKPFHLSYPQLIEHNSETYMLPEASKSGALTLYRAKHFPNAWEPVAELLPLPAIDATVIHYQNRWWMFYSLPDTPYSALHIAYADSLAGPWLQHTQNPVLTDIARARPAGTPFIHEGTLIMPAQDCSATYGGGITLNRIHELIPEHFRAEAVRTLAPSLWPTAYRSGLHTLSGCGNITLIDVKRIERSPMRALVNLERRIRRLYG